MSSKLVGIYVSFRLLALSLFIKQRCWISFYGCFDYFPVGDVVVEISSAAANLQNLRLQKDGLTATSLEDNPAVIIPRHLQVNNADCSHLSFGSFGSGMSTCFSGSLQQMTHHDSSEVTKVADDVPLLNRSETR